MASAILQPQLKHLEPSNGLFSDGNFDVPSVPDELSIPDARLLDPKYLKASFYPGQEHSLDLTTLDIPYRLFALALSSLETVNDKYAVTKYENAFKWSLIMQRLRLLVKSEGIHWSTRDFYVVEFRSKLKSNIDRQLLFKLDKESHREATKSGGLLKYWFGTPDSERRNLATCLWRSKEDAIAGGRGPWHKKARAVTGSMYEEINVKGLRLRIEDDVKSWSFQPFV